MYCSKPDLINRFGEGELISLTDRNDSGVIDDAVIDQAITDASAVIDGYLGGRYQLPLSVIPETLKRFACDITRYYLYDNESTDRIDKLYDDAIKFLKSVSKGEVSLGISSAGGKAQSTDLPTIESDGTVFGRQQSSGFI